jgi:hypothetical protein
MTDDDIITSWTDRLLALTPGIPRAEAGTFVRDLYYAAQRALDQEQSETDFERDE